MNRIAVIPYEQIIRYSRSIIHDQPIRL
ncbi:MAG: hypothetical protein LZF60_340009 [Nitrospira sp.]|nr:MAG: hypothetical protein LZF60_340009 [Nitrospira sp.]